MCWQENEDHIGEGCVSTTWLQFNQTLYNLTGESKYIDEIEKTIYNHLLAAENPNTGCVSYYTALQGKKPCRCNVYGHCCLASIPRGIAAIPELVYTKDAVNGFNINIYTAGNFKDSITTEDNSRLAVELSVDSKFPAKGKAAIILHTAVVVTFNVALRVPARSNNFVAKADGIEYKGIAGQYLVIKKHGIPFPPLMCRLI